MPRLRSILDVLSGPLRLTDAQPIPEVDKERLVREYAKQMRARLRKVAGPSRPADHFARNKTRAALRGIRKEKPRQLAKDVLVSRFRPSPILDALVKDRKSRWIDIMRRDQNAHPDALSLRNFSFLTHPNETLAALKRLGEIETLSLSAVLNFQDKHCLDAGSFLVLADIWPKMAPIFIGGRMEKPIQKVLSATGVSKNNRMTMKAVDKPDSFADEEHPDVWAFPLQRRRPALSSRSRTQHLDPQAREVATDRFCNAVDEWLSVPEINQELTDSGRGWLGNIIGELLCNAERHSQPKSDDGDWSTTAFMVRRSNGLRSTLKCYIAFLSVGRSFAESLSDAAEDVRKKLQNYIEKHKAAGISAETLATVFALQDTITRDPAARESRSGGTGLQDVLEFVDQLGGNGPASADARVTIVSGRSCISLTRAYIPGVRRQANHPRLQWCNASNSSDDPPSAGVAFDLSEHFAGTLVSVAFTLDPEYLAGLTESQND